MKNKFLKIGLPIISMGAIAITAPILTSCNGDEGNNSQDTSAILANFGQNLTHTTIIIRLLTLQNLHQQLMI